MKLVLFPPARSADHTPAPRSLEGSSFSIGRGSEQDIAIADIRVPLKRARLVMRHGEPWIESLTPDPLWIDGHALLEAPLSPGRKIEVGRITLEVRELLPEGLILAASESYGADEDLRKSAEKYALGLRDLRLPVRGLSWLLGLTVLIAALAWPLWHVTGTDGRMGSVPTSGSGPTGILPPQQPTQRLAPPKDALAGFLSSGELSSAHRHFANQCEQCHVQLFQRVDDAACLQCHAAVDQHGNTGKMPASSRVAPACVDCHLEHQQDRRITLADARTCLHCHQQGQGTEQLAVTHLRHAHPEFQVRNSSQGLHFPHAKHLDPDGIRGAEGDQVLDCGSCHLPDAKGGFQRLQFESHCEQCHSIDLQAEDPFAKETPRTQVPHGSLAEVRDFVRGHYSQLALREVEQSTSIRKPPGAKSVGRRRQASQDWALAEAHREFVDLVERRSCGVCHSVSQRPEEGLDLKWDLSAPAIPDDYLPSTDFDHRSHQSTPCGDCHQAAQSDSSADWLMPTRAQCLGCHGGDDQREDGLANCQTCHSFHNTGADWPMHPDLGDDQP